MRRILFAAAVTLAAISSVQPVFAKISTNKISANDTSLNGVSVNGHNLNGRAASVTGANPIGGSVDSIMSIILPSGETIRR